MTEITRAASQREHEVIIFKRLMHQFNPPVRKVDMKDLIEQHGYIRPVGQNSANGLRYLRRRKSRGGNLVEQRLKEMVVRSIHHRYLGVVMMKILGERQ